MASKATFCALLLVLAGLYANKWYKRRGQWASLGPTDIVLVTGGSSGLGSQLVDDLLEGPVGRIVNIDVNIDVNGGARDHTSGGRLSHYQCDLGDDKGVRHTVQQIIAEVGLPTVVINNAGITHYSSLETTPAAEISRIIQTNLVSQITILKEILPLVTGEKRCFVVTVSSVLGIVNPAFLSIYSVTKAGLNSLHTSLSHEITTSNIRFLLVTPGQLDTKLFRFINPPKQFIAPVLSCRKLSQKIISRINTGERGVLMEPKYTNLLPVLSLLPFSIAEALRRFSQMDNPEII